MILPSILFQTLVSDINQQPPEEKEGKIACENALDFATLPLPGDPGPDLATIDDRPEARALMRSAELWYGHDWKELVSYCDELQLQPLKYAQHCNPGRIDLIKGHLCQFKIHYSTMLSHEYN